MSDDSNLMRKSADNVSNYESICIFMSPKRQLKQTENSPSVVRQIKEPDDDVDIRSYSVPLGRPAQPSRILSYWKVINGADRKSVV